MKLSRCAFPQWPLTCACLHVFLPRQSRLCLVSHTRLTAVTSRAQDASIPAAPQVTRMGRNNVVLARTHYPTGAPCPLATALQTAGAQIRTGDRIWPLQHCPEQPQADGTSGVWAAAMRLPSLPQADVQASGGSAQAAGGSNQTAATPVMSVSQLRCNMTRQLAQVFSRLPMSQARDAVLPLQRQQLRLVDRH